MLELNDARVHFIEVQEEVLVSLKRSQFYGFYVSVGDDSVESLVFL